VKLPEQDNYEIALKLTKEDLLAADLEERAQKVGAMLGRDGNMKIAYFGQQVQINMPEVDMKYEHGPEVELREQILILHYINNSTGTEPVGEWVSFRDMPAGQFYYDAFERRSIGRLLKVYGTQPEKLVQAGKLIGGESSQYGDHAVSLRAFPRLPILCTIWEGDEELDPTANILFDRTVDQHLVTEDVAVLAGLAVSRLNRAARRLDQEQ